MGDSNLWQDALELAWISEDKLLAYASVVMQEDGSYIEFRAAAPEEVELVYTLLECASPEKATERTVLEIIEEEAAYLFDGSKSAEEVAEVTQNRVQLYLDER